MQRRAQYASWAFVRHTKMLFLSSHTRAYVCTEFVRGREYTFVGKVGGYDACVCNCVRVHTHRRVFSAVLPRTKANSTIPSPLAFGKGGLSATFCSTCASFLATIFSISPRKTKWNFPTFLAFLTRLTMCQTKI